MMCNPRMFSIRQIADILQLSRSLVYREIHSGRLRSHRFGKRCYRVSEDDLAVYLKAHASQGWVPERSSLQTSKNSNLGQLRHLKI